MIRGGNRGFSVGSSSATIGAASGVVQSPEYTHSVSPDATNVEPREPSSKMPL